MDPADLERLIDRELQRLPSPRAPRTLLPRVMQAVRMASRSPVSEHNWFDWPRLWQVASIAAVVVLVAGAVQLWPVAYTAFTTAVRQPAGGGDGRLAGMVSGIVQQVDMAASAVRVVWRVLHPMLIPLFVFFGVMAAACAACGVALRRVAL